MERLLESLSEIERAIVPYLHQSIDEIVKKSGLDRTTVIRAINFLENKNILKTENTTKKEVDLGINGVHYRKTHLPERTLLMAIEQQNNKPMIDIQNSIKLSENEFKAALGALKRKNFIALENGRIKISANKEDLSKKFPEELFLERLPIKLEDIKEIDKLTFENLKSRKDILEITETKELKFTLTEIGKKIAGKKIESDLIEEVTPELIKEFPRGKKFRRYDLQTRTPSIYGGKKHFVNQTIEYGKKIWLELGFKEMTGDHVVTSFWNFDALFTAQDHPVREMQDTFFIKNAIGKLPNNSKVVEQIKKAHETGIDGSKGWQYFWQEEDSKKVILRTHTTCLSAKTLSNLKQNQLPAKFFSVAKCFRNETVDWKHGFEFNQSEGIVIDPNANFRHLLGYIREFYKKMGFEKIKINPSYFPYTEPSFEIHAFHPEKKEWIELGGAGIFRPEVTIPLLGSKIPVLAWGPGFDRILLMAHEIKDLRELYKNDLNFLRNQRMLIK